MCTYFPLCGKTILKHLHCFKLQLKVETRFGCASHFLQNVRIHNLRIRICENMIISRQTGVVPMPAVLNALILSWNNGNYIRFSDYRDRIKGTVQRVKTYFLFWIGFRWVTRTRQGVFSWGKLTHEDDIEKFKWLNETRSKIENLMKLKIRGQDGSTRNKQKVENIFGLFL